MAFDTMCPQCGGLIMKPNVPYGWAGDVCHCPKKSYTDGESWKELQDLKRRLADLEDKKGQNGLQ
jgi:hypothetical protein